MSGIGRGFLDKLGMTWLWLGIVIGLFIAFSLPQSLIRWSLCGCSNGFGKNSLNFITFRCCLKLCCCVIIKNIIKEMKAVL